MTFEHTFVICAYKESKYLEACIQSVKGQSNYDQIIMTTSTPNTYIEGLAEKYGIPLFINDGVGDLCSNWNFGLSQAKTPFITLCHQDCLYDHGYYLQVKQHVLNSKMPLIIFTDYYEIKGDKIIKKKLLFLIRKCLSIPLLSRCLRSKKFFKRFSLAFGPAICCPSVTFARNNLMDPVFIPGNIALDWQAWEKISKLDGEFIYINRQLMYNRLHETSCTTSVLSDNTLYKDSLIILEQFWPKPVSILLAKLLNGFQRSNN